MRYDIDHDAYVSFAAVRTQIASSSLTPSQLLERCLDAIDTKEKDVRAFVRYEAEDALAQAHASTLRYKKGNPLSAIDGMPVVVKDCFDVIGYQTRNNSALFEDVPAASVDAAHVAALRAGGAVIIGKTVTTEVTMAAPGPTWNPWDLTRTPGGSSSGSAAAVAAGMASLGTGSQVRGSVIRPASICGVAGFKPTFGSLNRHGGFDSSPGINHLGFLGASFDDIWLAATHIGKIIGADPGHRTIQVTETVPTAQKPKRLLRQYTRGWAECPDSTKALFEAYLENLEALDIEIVEPELDRDLERYEALTCDAPATLFPLVLWECRWPLMRMVEAAPEKVSDALRGYISRAAAMNVDEYEAALGRQAELRNAHEALKTGYDACITLAHIGPGQIGQPGGGTPWFNDASSLIGAPSVNLPVLKQDGAPLGIQLLGFQHDDERLMKFSQWLTQAALDI